MTESVSYVVALRQSSVIFAVLLGAYLLKESQTKLRFAAGSGDGYWGTPNCDSMKQDSLCAMFRLSFPDLPLLLPSRIWLRFPPIVCPEPLIRILSDIRLKDFQDTRSISLYVLFKIVGYL